MGIQQFYLWLVRRYPLTKQFFNPSQMPCVDHLYLDVNGIIHRCAKDESVLFKKFLKGKSTEQIMISIIEYMDYVISLVRPQKSIFIAIDGVAPRAKMTSQKKDRYKKQKTDKILDDFLKSVLEAKDDLLDFKSGTISPGTAFMQALNKYIDFYLIRKFEEDPFWKSLEVVFSPGSVPGEGEHKILEYIRRKKVQQNFNISESHCIYSNDADIIMLSLSTHLPYINILRESMIFKTADVMRAAPRESKEHCFEYFYVNILREYMEMEYSLIQEKLPKPFSIDKIINDFILLCFFIGNDFLRKLYCLNVRLGNLDQIINIFKNTYSEVNSYFMEGTKINWNNFRVLIKNICQQESNFISGALHEITEYHDELDDLENKVKNRLEQAELQEKESKENQPNIIDLSEIESNSNSIDQSSITNITLNQLQAKTGENQNDSQNKSLSEVNQIFNLDPNFENFDEENKSEDSNLEKEIEVQEMLYDVEELEKKQQKAKIQGLIDHFKNQKVNETSIKQSVGLDQKFKSLILAKEKSFLQEIDRLYYENKKKEAKKIYYLRFFKIDIDKEDGKIALTNIIQNYLQGIQFVITYYFEGCPSWTWYNKYTLSPFLSDVYEYLENFGENINQLMKFEFDLNKPADPFLQLLFVLPPQASDLLPQEFRKIMTSTDSPVIQYYPIDFEMSPIDTKLDYAWVPLLPYVDDKKIETEYYKVLEDSKDKIDETILSRNAKGKDKKYVYDLTKETNVANTIISDFGEFISHALVEDFDFYNLMPLLPEKIFQENLMLKNAGFPSLQIFHDFQPVIETKTNKRTGSEYQRILLVGYKRKTQITFDKSIDTNNKIYFGYPFQEEGYIGALLTPRGPKIYTGISLPDLDQYYQSDYPKVFYEIQKEVMNDYNLNKGIKLGDLTEIVIVEKISKHRTNPDCNSKPIVSTYLMNETYIPSYFITSNKYVYSLVGNPDKGDIGLSQDDTYVCVENGSICKLASLHKNKPFECNIQFDPMPDIRIGPSILKQYKKFHKVTDALLNTIGIENRYFGILWVVAESFVVETDTSRESFFILGEAFDLGLRIFDIYLRAPRFETVPDLARVLPDGKEEKREKQIYKYTFMKNNKHTKGKDFYQYDIRFSDIAVNLLKEYFGNQKNKSIIDYMKSQYDNYFTSKHIMYNRFRFKSTDIYKNREEDANIKLMEPYVWIISQDAINLTLRNKYNIVVNKECIKAIQSVVDAQNKEFKENMKQKQSKVVETEIEMSKKQEGSLLNDISDKKLFQPASQKKQILVLKQYLVKFNKKKQICFPPMKFHPEIHKPGDRIICLNPHYPAFLPFGKKGTVIGVYEYNVEIMVDEPYIGGSTLGGRCPNFRGFVVYFEDVFNITRWVSNLNRSVDKNSSIWLGQIELKKILHEIKLEIQEQDKQAFNKNKKQPGAKQDKAPSVYTRKRE